MELIEEKYHAVERTSRCNAIVMFSFSLQNYILEGKLA